MPIVKIPTPLQSYVDGQKAIIVDGSTVNEAILNLAKKYPSIKQHIFDPEGRLRAFIKIFLEEENIKELVDGLDLVIKEGDSLVIIASIAGG
jgi:adenylyltransferase/sulfurtransferase